MTSKWRYVTEPSRAAFYSGASEWASIFANYLSFMQSLIRTVFSQSYKRTDVYISGITGEKICAIGIRYFCVCHTIAPCLVLMSTMQLSVFPCDITFMLSPSIPHYHLDEKIAQLAFLSRYLDLCFQVSNSCVSLCNSNLFPGHSSFFCWTPQNAEMPGEQNGKGREERQALR